jgi:hypothetical protein
MQCGKPPSHKRGDHKAIMFQLTVDRNENLARLQSANGEQFAFVPGQQSLRLRHGLENLEAQAGQLAVFFRDVRPPPG